MKIKELKDRLKAEPPKDFKKLQGFFKKLGVIGGLMILFPLTAVIGGFIVSGATVGGILCQLPNEDLSEEKVKQLTTEIEKLKSLGK